MRQIAGNKVALKEPTDKDIDELYFWKYEEKEQEAKKWNGPYIPQREITREEYQRRWSEEILPTIPTSMVIAVQGKAIGDVGSYWVDQNTNWLETGIVIYDKGFWNGGYGSEAY